MLIRSCTFLLLIISSAAVSAGDRPRVFQTAEVQPAGTSAEGAAWLKRSKNKVEGRVMAKVDRAGTPYTIWWVIFNNPAGCLGDCGPADLMADGGAAADVAIFNASGAISAASGDVDGGGVINVDLSVIGGESAGNGAQNAFPGAPPFFLKKLRRNNGLCAEIHLDINEHVIEDPENPDWVAELTYPEFPQAFAIFPAVGECSRRHHDDDDSSD